MVIWVGMFIRNFRVSPPNGPPDNLTNLIGQIDWVSLGLSVVEDSVP